jgi:formylglycine-generating enzyme required for sulfatase activity
LSRDGCGPSRQLHVGSNDLNEQKPPHRVDITKPLAVGKFTVTFAEWDACVATGGCNHKPEDQGWGRSTRPVINVSWEDAILEYLPWFSRKAGKTYRLLTEAEWEYAARAGTTTTYFWGNDIGKNLANCDGCGNQWDGKQTAPVGSSFKPNAFGLFDMDGNVWQWVQDCWHDPYQGAPTDGSAWVKSCPDDSRRVLRGGSWRFDPKGLSAATRIGGTFDIRDVSVGFRSVRTLNP